MATSTEKDVVVQCKTCPWRVTVVPARDIPRYDPTKHAGLTNTIQSGLATLFTKERHIMACHYSRPGVEFACAGWLHQQIGVGNNLGLRFSVMEGRMPTPEVDGPQRESFEDTLCGMPAASPKLRKNRNRRGR